MRQCDLWRSDHYLGNLGQIPSPWHSPNIFQMHCVLTKWQEYDPDSDVSPTSIGTSSKESWS
jgi:hypothetical protein